MKHVLACFGLVTILSGAAFRQSSDKLPTFDAADIRPGSIRSLAMTGPFIGGGLYRLRAATMVDLIATAYGVDANKVAGGPAWLGFDRFDVTATVPAGTSAATIKAMLQALLQERFKLKVHNGNSPVPVYGLTVVNKPLLKPSDGAVASGCKTQPIPGSFHLTNGGVSYACRSMTMTAFADTVRNLMGSANLNGYPVVDQTNLTGSWDFDITFRRSGAAVPPGEETLYFSDAIPKQLGIQLRLTKASMAALVVDTVNQQPTPNPLNAADILSVLPTAFEVADVKPSPPDTRVSSLQVQPGGRLNVQGMPLMALIVRAWDLQSSEMVAGPKFLDTERFNILAKIASLPSESSDPGLSRTQDNDLLNPMLRTLLMERFKMVVHQEERPVTAYLLKATRAKLQKADPSNRSGCLRGAGTGADVTQAANQVNAIRFSCQNMTMAQFATFMEGSPFTPLTPRGRIIDETGVAGAWDFTLMYTPGSELAGTGEPSGGVASTPTGRSTLFEALEAQLGLKLEKAKRPASVLVIDQMEQKPSQN